MNKLKNITLLINTLKKNKWYIIVYILFIVIFTIYQYVFFHNFASPKRNSILLIILIIIGTFCILYNSFNQKKLFKVAFITIMLFGILTLLLSPMLIGCDENEHLNRADLTSMGIIVPHYEKQIDKKEGFSVEHFCSHVAGTTRFSTVFTTKWDDQPIDTTKITEKSAFAHNPFYCYIPQGFGIFLAKELHLNTIWILWLGGLFNLLMYAGVSSYAIKKSPILKIPMLAVACLPFAVYQGTTVSSDSFVNAFALLLMAYFFYMYKSPKKTLNMKYPILFLILCILIGLIKPPLLLLSILIVLIPKENFKQNKYYDYSILSIFLVIFIGILWYILYSIPASAYSFRGPRAKKLPVNPKMQLKFLLGSYKHFTTIMLDIIKKSWFVIRDMFRFADWQGTPRYSSKLMAIIFTVFYGLLSLFYPIKYKINDKKRIVSIILFFTIYISFFIVQYLTWSKVGQLHITGVQGRYFIPLLILIPFFLNMNSDNTKIGRKIQNKIKISQIEQINTLSYIIIIGLLGCLQILTLGIYY